MKLDKLGLSFYKDWEEKGYSLPEYDREAVAEYTHEHLSGFILVQEISSAPSRPILRRLF